MSITFKQPFDLLYVRTLLEREMGLPQYKLQTFIENLKGNQNYEIMRGKISVGLISVRFEKEFLFLNTVVIDKRARKQQEIGKKVMDRLEVEAQKRNKQAIYCYVPIADRQQTDWYQKHGFILTDQGRDYSVMEKNIASKAREGMEDNYLLIHFPL